MIEERVWGLCAGEGDADRQTDRRLRIIQTDISWSIISVGSGVVGRGAAKIHIWATHTQTDTQTRQQRHAHRLTHVGASICHHQHFPFLHRLRVSGTYLWVNRRGGPQVWEALATNDSLRFCDFLLPWYSLTPYAFFYQETSMTSREHDRKSAEKVMHILLYHNNVRLITLWNILTKLK